MPGSGRRAFGGPGSGWTTGWVVALLLLGTWVGWGVGRVAVRVQSGRSRFVVVSQNDFGQEPRVSSEEES